MKPLKWKSKRRNDVYGKWHLLELGFRHYSGMWIREPLCLEELRVKRWGGENKHKDVCPAAGECGWEFEFSELDIHTHHLKATSLEEAKAEAKSIVTARLTRFLETLEKVI